MNNRLYRKPRATSRPAKVTTRVATKCNIATQQDEKFCSTCGCRWATVNDDKFVCPHKRKG